MKTYIHKILTGFFIITLVVGASFTAFPTRDAYACSYQQGTFFPQLSDIIAKNRNSPLTVFTFAGTITNTTSTDLRYTENPLNVRVNNYYNDGTATNVEIPVPETLTLENDGNSCGTIFTKKYVVITGMLSDLEKGNITDSGTDYIQISQYDTLAEAQAEALRIKALLVQSAQPGSGVCSFNPISRRIARGHRGADVVALQNALNQLRGQGQQLVVDGSFGRGTLAAVKEFQQMKALGADGIVGPITTQALCRYIQIVE